jgi:hypothetical protein
VQVLSIRNFWIGGQWIAGTVTTDTSTAPALRALIPIAGKAAESAGAAHA